MQCSFYIGYMFDIHCTTYVGVFVVVNMLAAFSINIYRKKIINEWAQLTTNRKTTTEQITVFVIRPDCVTVIDHQMAGRPSSPSGRICNGGVLRTITHQGSIYKPL